MVGSFWIFKPQSDIQCKLRKCLQENFLRKRSAFVNKRNIVFLHNNVGSHSARITQEKIMELGRSVSPYPPYSPDLAPSDFQFLGFLQNGPNNKKKTSQDDQLKTAVENFLNSKPSEFYLRGINKLSDKWQEEIQNKGKYIFDGD